MSEVRLIDANVLAKELERVYLKKEVDEVGEEVYKAVVHIYSTILCMPTIDAEPVRHGRWIKKATSVWCCSICLKENLYAYYYDLSDYTALQDYYCPNCGAKMNEVKK